MAFLGFRRRAQVKQARKRRAAPLTQAGLSAAARRANRMVAAVALFGAFGAVALAVALTPGAQHSATGADASQGSVERVPVAPGPISEAPASEASLSETPVTMSRIEVPAPPAAEALATVPPRATKSDRLGVEPQRVKTDLSTGPQPLPAPPRPAAGEHRMAVADAVVTDEAMADEAVIAAEATDADAGLEPEGERSLEFGLADPPPPGAVEGLGDEVVVERAGQVGTVDAEAGSQADSETDSAADSRAGYEVDDEAVEAAVKEAVKVAIPEPAATARVASVNSDVNLRAKPDNAGAVILVVPRNGEVEVIGCDYWCEVVYKGTRGFIYKGFVRGASS